MPSSVIELAVSSYGPYAFGVVSLLTIWFSIVAPELNSRQIDYEKQSHIVSQQKQIADVMESTAVTMQATAAMMEATTQSLSSTVERLIRERERDK